MPSRIYLDNAATTPVDPQVLESMLPYFNEIYGNASSKNHSFGWDAEQAVEQAREQIANLLGASAKEIIFTSGATEANNLAVIGGALYQKHNGKTHIITTKIEHKAVLDPCHYLKSIGFDVTYLSVNKEGLIDLNELKQAIRKETALISIIAGNNELGTLQPIAEIGKMAKEANVWFHTDATQAVGKVPIDVIKDNIDLLSLSGHKIYGPKGIGALYVRRKNPRIRLEAVQHGGGHERGMRSGTLNVPGIVGLGKAASLCHANLAEESKKISSLRDYLEEKIMQNIDHVTINGSTKHRLPNILNISFAFVEGESLMMGMPDIAVSSGSACTSASLEPSYVLHALGISDDLAHCSIRFSLGRFTTKQEIETTFATLQKTVSRLREMSPLYDMVKSGIDLSSIQWKGH